MTTKKIVGGFTLAAITRAVFGMLVIFALSVIVFDAGNLITREAVTQRWTLGFVVLIVNTVVWFLTSPSPSKIPARLGLSILLTLSLIVFAGFITYWERGMASTSTILYVFPLLSAAVLKSRKALLAAATLSAGTYAFAAVKYFNDFFNEGYRVQLWGNLLFYCGLIFVAAWALNSLFKD